MQSFHKTAVLGILIASLLPLSSCGLLLSEAELETLSFPSAAEIPVASLPYTVAQAYQAIPHQRTEFDPDFSPIPTHDKAYLSLMFPLIDQAIALRVTMLNEFTDGNRTAERLQQYQSLIDFTATITPPAHLQHYHTSIHSAMQAQHRYFQEWKSQSTGFRFKGRAVGNHPEVQAASSDLIAAYNHLMQTYPQEDSINKAAFFDYHCALDFI